VRLLCNFQASGDVARIASQKWDSELSVMKEPDPEASYHVGEMMAYCGQKEPALRFADIRGTAELLRLFGTLVGPTASKAARDSRVYRIAV
jgi:hypothetical protein